MASGKAVTAQYIGRDQLELPDDWLRKKLRQRSRHRLLVRVRRLVWAGLLTVVISLAVSARTNAQEAYTAADVQAWIEAYSARYATAAYPYEALAADAERVARCESVRFDSRVINNARRGALGEVGTYQFMPGPRSIFWGTPSAAAGFDYWDPEANVAGAVWLISMGYGPRHWSCW